MARESMDRAADFHDYSQQPNAGGDKGDTSSTSSKRWSPGLIRRSPSHGVETRKKPFELGKLQIAGILLVVVFVWGIVSAVAIAMFEIHLLSLTVFEDDGRSDVYGTVTDENGQNLENVTVVIHGTYHFTRTNSEGFYSIENVTEGDYEIEASLANYGSVTKRVTLNANIPILVDFVLEEGGFDKTINERYESHLSELQFLNHVTAIFIIIYGSLALAGGILAYFQRFYWVAMFGGLCGIISGVLSIGIIVAPILSIIALVLIIRNQEEFMPFETSFIGRFLGLDRAEARARGVSREGAEKFERHYKPIKLKPKAMKSPYVKKGPITPSTAISGGKIQQKERMRRRGAERTGEPSLTCLVCKGAIKNESQGIVCQCGASYHRFCASSISRCRKCGNPF